MPIWSLCHLPTDGKEPAAFAVSWRTAKAAVSHLTDTNTTHFAVRFFAVRRRRQTATAKTGSAKAFFAVCFLQRTAKRPLPSVADGKGHVSLPSAGRRQRARLFAICWQTAKAAGSLPSVGRWQRDQIGINSVSSYINSFSQKIKHIYIYDQYSISNTYYQYS